MNKEQQQVKKNNRGCFATIFKSFIVLFLLATNTLTILIATGYIAIQDSKAVAPEYPENVPKSAIWHGGIDGGYFYELVDIKDDIYRIRVYNDYTGKAIIDSDFKLESIKITKDNWCNMSPYYYGGDDFGLQTYLKFNPISPAYEEEVMKTKKY